jgi:hypothetical protein
MLEPVKGVYFSQTTDMSNNKISSWNVTELKVRPRAHCRIL